MCRGDFLRQGAFMHYLYGQFVGHKELPKNMQSLRPAPFTWIPYLKFIPPNLKTCQGVKWAKFVNEIF